MNQIRVTLLLIGIAISLMASSGSSAQPPSTFSYTPPRGFVPDGQTATLIAEAVLVPIYGADTVRSERPFTAQLHGDVWTVVGSMPHGLVGGVALIEISKVDGKILRVTHGK